MKLKIKPCDKYDTIVVFDKVKELAELWRDISWIPDVLAGMKRLRRDRGTNGWVVDYKTLERITAKAYQIEPVSMEEAEAVILALVDEHFARLEDE